MTIRWARGFFRLWLLLSVLWVLALAALWWQPVFSPRPYLSSRHYAVPVATGRPEPIADGELEAFYAAKQTGKVKLVEFSAPPGHPDLTGNSLFVRTTTSDADISAAIDQIAAGLIKEEAAEIVRLQSANIPAAIMSTLLPPIIVLILGAALGWVLRGFTRGAKQQARS